jgi:hypothetical protein
MLHGRNPGKLAYLKQESVFYENDKTTAFDTIFSDAVKEWAKKTNRHEPDLTKMLARMIDKESAETGYHADGEASVDLYIGMSPRPNGAQPARLDILFSPELKNPTTASTPFALIEVGRSNANWFAKASQNLKYLRKFDSAQSDARLRFDDALLFGVLTIEGEEKAETNRVEVKLGVFLCSPNEPKSADFRMSLLFCLHTYDLLKASQAFGTLLRTGSDFGRWRSRWKTTLSSQSWMYLGPNCCLAESDVSARVQCPNL